MRVGSADNYYLLSNHYLTGYTPDLDYIYAGGQ